MDDRLPQWIVVQQSDEHIELVLFRAICLFADLTTVGAAGPNSARTSIALSRSLGSRRASDGKVDVGVFDVDTGCDGRD